MVDGEYILESESNKWSKTTHDNTFKQQKICFRCLYTNESNILFNFFLQILVTGHYFFYWLILILTGLQIAPKREMWQ